MGVRLAVLAAQPAWGNLDYAARSILLIMSLTARDSPTPNTPAATYWGGHEYLATALRGNAEPAALQVVKRAIRELRQAGAIELVEAAHRGRQAVYRVTVKEPNQDMLPVDNVVPLHQKGDHSVTPKRGQI